MIYLTIFLNLTIFTLVYPKILYQESFEQGMPASATIETRYIQIQTEKGIGTASIDLTKSGYVRFPVPVAKDTTLLFFRFRTVGLKEKPEIIQLMMLDTAKAPYKWAYLLRLGGADGLFNNAWSPDVWNSIELRITRNKTSPDFVFKANGRTFGTFALPSMDFNRLELLFGGGGPAFAGPARLLVNTIVVSDQTVSFDDSPPDISVSVADTDRIVFDAKSLAIDSVYFVVLSDSHAPLLVQEFQAETFHSYRLKFPVRKGDYHVTINAIRKGGLKSAVALAGPIRVESERAAGAYPVIEDAEITHEKSGRAVERVVPGRWYVLTARFSQVNNGFAIFSLHTPDKPAASSYNRGGIFNRADNYIINFSLGPDPWLYTAREDIKGRSLRIDGREGLYMDDQDRFFRVDTANRTVRARFKLLPEAVAGEWLVTGYMESDPAQARSYPFRKRFEVISMMQAQKEEKAQRLWRAGILAGVVVLAGTIILAFRKSRKAVVPVRLLEQEVFLKDPEFKHRHLVARAQSYMRENFTKDISLQNVVDYMGLSPAWLVRIFKQGTGLTVVEYLNRLRIEKARLDLKRTQLPIMDVAMSCGFMNEDHFGRVFRQVTGRSPTQYRKEDCRA